MAIRADIFTVLIEKRPVIRVNYIVQQFIITHEVFWPVAGDSCARWGNVDDFAVFILPVFKVMRVVGHESEPFFALLQFSFKSFSFGNIDFDGDQVGYLEIFVYNRRDDGIFPVIAAILAFVVELPFPDFSR